METQIKTASLPVAGHAGTRRPDNSTGRGDCSDRFRREPSVNRTLKIALILVPSLLLMAGCSSNKPSGQQQSDSRYTMSQDTGPTGDYDISDLKDAVPRAEPYSRGGNRSTYTVWGKSYNVMPSGDGYEATGIASWYGAKFHGHKTSNGETYDMYSMTAAHRNLPLPSFVQVTNLANGRQAIVRVNDRGPFHSDRIIDLSYAAAKKLDFMDKGTARVRVAAITVNADGSWNAAGGNADVASAGGAEAREPPAAEIRAYVQVGAFRSADSAQAFRSQVARVTEVPVDVVRLGDDDGWHRVHVGPFESRKKAEAERDRIRARQVGQPIVVMSGS